MSEYLQAIGITKRYGGVYALKGADFELRAGEVHALMGENGAGKSTLARILAGSTRADSGAISLGGTPVEIATPLDAQRLGIGIIYQELDLFDNLTVGENIVIGNLHFPEGRLVSFRRMEEFCRPFLDQVGLACGSRQITATLSIGQKQLLAIARALSMNARILLMDEPTSSLFDDAAERLFGLIASLKQRGVSIVYVSHKMDEIFRICDRATVLRDGETVGTVEMAGASASELIRMMVGRELQFTTRSARRAAGETVLTAENLTTAKLKGVSFGLRSGEVLGVAGLVGSGRSELGAALFGIDPLTERNAARARRIALAPLAAPRHGERHRTAARRPPPAGADDAHERASECQPGRSAGNQRLRVHSPPAGRGHPGSRRAATGAQLPLDRGAGQPVERRQSAKGAAGALAALQSQPFCFSTTRPAASMSAPSRTSTG